MPRPLNMAEATPARTPQVSDHALLRWMERRMGMDLDAIRADILTAERQAAIRCGASSIHCREEGVTLIVAPNGTIVTAMRGMHRKGR